MVNYLGNRQKKIVFKETNPFTQTLSIHAFTIEIGIQWKHDLVGSTPNIVLL